MGKFNRFLGRLIGEVIVIGLAVAVIAGVATGVMALCGVLFG